MDNGECMVSIVCTAFNHESYIRSALEGFVAQKADFAYEVLINDDCSADGTAAVIREYEAKYPELIRAVYQSENQYSKGVDITVDILFPLARGKYIAYCEGDDYWTDDSKLQKQVDFLEAHPDYSACVHGTIAHYCDGSRQDAPFVTVDCEHDVSFDDTVNGMSFSFHTCSLMARAELMFRLPDFYRVGTRFGFGDHPIALWLLLNGAIRCLGGYMSVYRVASNPDSWSSNLGKYYIRLRRFVTGKLEMLRAIRPYVSGERAKTVERVILEREFELLDVEGRVDELVKPPYDGLYRAMPLKFRAKTQLKRLFPKLHRAYRRRKGYND